MLLIGLEATLLLTVTMHVDGLGVLRMVFLPLTPLPREGVVLNCLKLDGKTIIFQKRKKVDL